MTAADLPPDRAEPIPVTVLTGFLGSGKTTLLARLIRSPEFARTAVIINEFGAVGIDHDLVEASEESFVELETGCLCCTIRGDLEATLADLVARRSRGLVPAFERIVIETSGLADPAPVLNAVMAEAGRGAGIALDGVVTTVDAVAGSATLAREPQSVRQVAVADRVILTKTDLSDGAEAVDGLKRHLVALNPRAPVLAAIMGEIAPGRLLGGGMMALAGAPEVEAWLAADAAGASGSAPAVATAGLDPARHGDGIVSLSLRRERPLPALVLTLLLEALADHCGADLLRLKGLIHVAERADQPAVVHGVQHVFHAPQWLERWPSADRGSRLVLIGRGLSQSWVERLLDALEAEVAEVQAAGQRDGVQP